MDVFRCFYYFCLFLDHLYMNKSYHRNDQSHIKIAKHNIHLIMEKFDKKMSKVKLNLLK